MEKLFANSTFFSETSAKILGGAIGLLIGCTLLVLVVKVLNERHEKIYKEIIKDQKARKSGKKVKRTVGEKIKRFFVHYFPMLLLLAILIGIMAAFLSPLLMKK